VRGLNSQAQAPVHQEYEIVEMAGPPQWQCAIRPIAADSASPTRRPLSRNATVVGTGRKTKLKLDPPLQRPFSTLAIFPDRIAPGRET
jgi:hypothetical protein